MTLEAALSYAERGIRIFPGVVVKGRRQPAVKAFYDAATTDEAQIRAWWQRNPDAWIAVATGPTNNLVVIDQDTKRGVDGIAAWRSLTPPEYEFRGPRARTASGGLHDWYSWTEWDKHELRNSASEIADGIDVRAWHGFVWVPPSGGREWITEPGKAGELSLVGGATAPIPPLPQWGLELLLGGKTGERTSAEGPRSNLTELLENPPEGPDSGRNNWLSKVAGHYALMFGDRVDAYELHVWRANELLSNPLEEDEVKRTLESILRSEMDKRAHLPTSSAFALTDTGNASRLASLYGDELRYVPESKHWLAWDGMRWARDSQLNVYELAKEVTRAIIAEAQSILDSKEANRVEKWGLTSQNMQRLDAMIKAARSTPPIPAPAAWWDTDPWVLNTATGTLDLRTAQLRAHERTDMLTKLAPVEYDPSAECPAWDTFLLQVFDGDIELVAFLRRAAGYTLTGSVRERAIFVLHGIGRNGKSTLLNVLRSVLGDYHTKTQAETLVQKRGQSGSGVNNHIAALAGARLVVASESDAGDRLAAATVKDLTGGESIVARFLYGEYFNFDPTFKLWLGTNHKPNADATDKAIWDRILLVPFLQRFEGKNDDKQLGVKLAAELPGVLAWAVRGCLEWQEGGLRPPAPVLLATEQYRDEGDVIGEWLSIYTMPVPHDKPRRAALMSELHASYTMWCNQGGDRPLGRRRFGETIRAKGFDIVRSDGMRVLGLALRAPGETSQEGTRNFPADPVTSQRADLDEPF